MADLPYWRLSGFYFFYFALLGATAPFLALYFDYLGFSPARIGELLAIPLLMRCVAPNLWGWLADRSGQRLLILRLGALCTWLSLALIFLQQSYAWLALVMALHAFFWHAVLPQFEALTLAHLGDQVARYSQLRLWGSVGFIVAVALLGLAFDHWSMAIYPETLLLIISGIVLASLWLPKASVSAATPQFLPAFWQQLRRPQLWSFYAAVALMQLSHGPYYSFLSIHLQGLGYDKQSVGLLWALGVVAEIILFAVMPKLLERFSLTHLLAASCLLAALRWWLLGFYADQLLWLLLAQLMHAATFGCFHGASIALIQRSFADCQQGQGQALYAALAGVGGALGALYAGYSWRGLGAGWTFTLAGVAALSAVALLLWSQRRVAL